MYPVYQTKMAVSKIRFYHNIKKLEALLRPGISHCRKAECRSITCSSYCSSKDNSSSASSNKFIMKSNLQPVPKKNFELSDIPEKDRALVEILKEGSDPYYPYKGSYDKVASMLADNFKVAASEIVHFCTGIKLNIADKPFYPRQIDLIIIGCNPIGLSIAYALRERCRETPTILVIDKNNQFPHTSTNIGQSMLMQQLFIDEEEIAMNKYAAEFLASFPRLTEMEGHPRFKVSYEPLGSLLLADETNADKLVDKIEKLRMHGIINTILDTKALKNKFPWLKLDKVLFGCLGMTNEGIYDPWSFLNGLKCKAVNLGVQFMTAEVLDFGVDDYRIPKRVICKLPDGSYHPIDFCKCVLACGVQSVGLVEKLNLSNLGPRKIRLPIEERMRYEYCFYSPKGPGLDTPIVVDSDGTYFRREGLCNYYVAGVPNVPYGEQEELGPYSVFINKVKPFLEKRVPQFDQVDLIKGWIDSYDFCVSNEVGILGPHPEDSRIIFALGFSHLGLQHAPAIGRAIMESIVYDEYKGIDLSRYHIENLWIKQHLEADKKKKELLESKERIAITN